MSDRHDLGEEDPNQHTPRRLIGEIPYELLLSAPRVIAEGIRARLEQSRIPVYLETPFTSFGLPEAYMGTYTGDVSLWVPQALHKEAVLIIARPPPRRVIMSVVGIDLGGTKIMAGVLSEGVIRARVTVPTPEEGGKAVIAAMAQAALSAIEAAGIGVKAIGLGTPGPLDFKRGRIKFAPNIANFTDFPIVELLEKATGYKVYMENDANAAALAEHKLGAAQGAESTLFMTVSTGVGGGFVWGNRVLRGVNGQGGEIGHITMQPGGPLCGCGLDGCLEALATGPAMERMAQASFKREMGTRELFALFQQGDPRASRIVLQAASWVGIALASLVKCYDPEVVVLGGGVALNAGPAYLDEVMRSYHRYMENWITPPIHLAKLGSEAGLLGAALTAALEVGEA